MAPLTDILIVDDEEELIEALSERLTLRGYRVTAVLSGEEAVLAVQTKPFDVVLLDIRLKGEDGIEVMQKLHELKPDLSVILLTGHISVGDGKKGTKAGAAETVLKPVQLSALIDTMTSVYNRKQQEAAE